MSSFGNERQGGGGKEMFVRVSGVFPTAKGNLIARINIDAFDTIYKMMQQAAQIGGSVNFIISKNKQSGKPEMYAVVGQPYNKPNQPQAQEAPGPFAQFGAKPVQAVVSQPTNFPVQATSAQGARNVEFGQADVPKDDFDKLLESL